MCRCKKLLAFKTNAVLGADDCKHKDDKLTIKGNDTKKQQMRKHMPLTSGRNKSSAGKYSTKRSLGAGGTNDRFLFTHYFTISKA